MCYRKRCKNFDRRQTHCLNQFSNAGQMCVAPDYVLVHQSVREKFIDELIKSIRQFFSEEPSSSYNYGKIVNEKQFNRLVAYLQHGKIMYGGKYDNLNFI